uniref:Flowering time control protein FPA n=1 Tax=Noccaea caerulescens TaxID=107243 RepID=A0A1J3CPY1_NOCCA
MSWRKNSAHLEILRTLGSLGNARLLSLIFTRWTMPYRQEASMNGKRIRGSYLRVDYLRSQAPRKEQWTGSYDNRNGNVNQKPQYPHSNEDAKGDGQQSSKVLWIG